MKFPNNSQLNLTLDIILDLMVECYILWNVKILLFIKLAITIKKILNVYSFNLLDYLSSGNVLLMEYAESKLFALRKENAMMKKYLKNKTLRPKMILELSQEFEDNNDYKRGFAKIAKSYKKESEKENAEEREDLNK